MIQYQLSKTSISLIENGFNHFNHNKVFKRVLDTTSQTITNLFVILAPYVHNSSVSYHLVKCCSLYQTKS